MESVKKCNLDKSEFPRPDFIRENWMSLNGTWDFAFSKNEQQQNTAQIDWTNEIKVPFCYQSQMSGIGETKDYPVVWYRRSFASSQHDGKVLIHFGAVDFIADIWVNGKYLGQHVGGYGSFSFDITDCLKDSGNEVIVRVADGLESGKPRGKQSWTGGLFGCWYTPVTGIWQSVWLEYAGERIINRVKITPEIDSAQARCEVFLNENIDTRIRLTAILPSAIDDVLVCEVTAKQGYATATFSFRDYDIQSEILWWSPDLPNLIDVVVETVGLHVDDKVETYFGMRKFQVSHGRILLNGDNCFQRLILDQGYWEESLLTPPSNEAIKRDIEITKAMGFNGARKHQKIEDPRYYYWADKLGLLVWGEVPSAYEFNDRAISLTTNELISFINRDYNHPCIITWVPINESWGVRQILTDKKQQDYASALYYLIRSLDQTRLISGNDGWEQTDASDFCAIHDYALFADNLDKYDDMKKIMTDSTLQRLLYADGHDYDGKPIIMTEYGGVALTDSDDGSWGYFGKVKNADEMLERIRVVTDMLIESRKFCGFCYTQLTDVMQEVNGLLNPDRTPKADIKKINEVFSKAHH